MRKIRLMVGCAAVAAAGVGVLGCGDSGSDSSGPATFTNDAYPFTFEYPSSFALSNDVTLNQNLGAQTEDNLALALDNSNGILLQKANLNVTVTKANLEAAKRQFDVLVARIDPGASGKATEIGGFPALEYGAIPVSSVPDGQSVITFLFQGQTEYVVNCQSTPDHRSEIDAGCDQALGTLKPAH